MQKQVFQRQYVRTPLRPILLAGMLGGITFLVFKIMMALVLGHSPFTPLRLIGAMVLGEGAISGGVALTTVVAAALTVHFVLSLIYGAVFLLIAVRIQHMRRSRLAVLSTACSLGFLLWVVNVLLVAPILFPWFTETQPLIEITARVLFFGLPMGLVMSRSLLSRDEHTNTESDRVIQPTGDAVSVSRNDRRDWRDRGYGQMNNAHTLFKELHMKRVSRPLTILVLVVGLMAAMSMAAMAAHGPVAEKQVGGKPLSATLTGAAEVMAGDPDGMGMARLTINIGQGVICYDISASDIGSVTGVHIHEAPVGVDGPVVRVLSFGSDCVVVSRELAKDIVQNPADYYVNVHTDEFPSGAIRGQLS